MTWCDAVQQEAKLALPQDIHKCFILLLPKNPLTCHHFKPFSYRECCGTSNETNYFQLSLIFTPASFNAAFHVTTMWLSSYSQGSGDFVLFKIQVYINTGIELEKSQDRVCFLEGGRIWRRKMFINTRAHTALALCYALNVLQSSLLSSA